jgi:hypothetical protein
VTPGLNPTNNMPATANQLPAPGQSATLDTVGFDFGFLFHVLRPLRF